MSGVLFIYLFLFWPCEADQSDQTKLFGGGSWAPWLLFLQVFCKKAEESNTPKAVLNLIITGVCAVALKGC